MSLSDIFKGPANASFDLMRIGGFSAFILYPFPFIWNCVKHGIVPDPSTYGVGYAAVIGAIGAACFTKDIGVAKANATAAQSGTPNA